MIYLQQYSQIQLRFPPNCYSVVDMSFYCFLGKTPAVSCEGSVEIAFDVGNPSLFLPYPAKIAPEVSMDVLFVIYSFYAARKFYCTRGSPSLYISGRLEHGIFESSTEIVFFSRVSQCFTQTIPKVESSPAEFVAEWLILLSILCFLHR